MLMLFLLWISDADSSADLNEDDMCMLKAVLETVAADTDDAWYC